MPRPYRPILTRFLNLIGPRLTYALYAILARITYACIEPIRTRSESQCAAALASDFDERTIKTIAKQAFINRTLNLADLILASKRINARNYAHHGGDIPEPYKQKLLTAAENKTPVILITSYVGPYDLLPLFLGYNNLTPTAVYKPHPDPNFDAFRQHVRTKSGCKLVPIQNALTEIPKTLETGGQVAILADQHDESKNSIPATFLNQPTRASKTIPLLAQQYKAAIAVAAIHRTRKPLHFEIIIADYFDAAPWNNAPNHNQYIADRYLTALEKIIHADPTQYLWANPRWNKTKTNHQSPRPPQTP